MTRFSNSFAILAALLLCIPTMAPVQGALGTAFKDPFESSAALTCLNSIPGHAAGLPNELDPGRSPQLVNVRMITAPLPALPQGQSKDLQCGGVASDVDPTPQPTHSCSTCTAADTPIRAHPPTPEPRVDLLSNFEAITDSTTALPEEQDWDQDAIPDPLDTVNLPSEAEQLTTTSDRLKLPDGLPGPGFALLVEPRHEEAYLIIAKTGTLPTATTWTGRQALDSLQSLFGIDVRNSLAVVLHENVSVQASYTAPLLPLDLSFSWSTAIPADGTWLLVQTDPMRSASVILGGLDTQLQARAPSQYSPSGWMDYRWSFINPHRGASHCFDPTTHLNGSLCPRYVWPDWLRAYSGQANYALQAAHAALKNGDIPLTAPLPVAPLVDAAVCAGESLGATVTFVQACIPPCEANEETIEVALCLPTVAVTCPTNSFGAQINGNNALCITACPPDSDLDALPCAPALENCPVTMVGVVLNGFEACLEVCEPDTLGFCIPSDCPYWTISWCFPVCPPDTLSLCIPDVPDDPCAGTSISGVCVPPYATCPWPTIGVTLNGEDVCFPLTEEQSSSTNPLSESQSSGMLLPTSSPPDAGEHFLPALFDGTSSWQVGTGSKLFNRGHGLDYRFDDSNVSGPSITQWNPTGAPPMRRFEFESALFNTPGLPRNYTQLLFAIQPLDGIESAATFAIDGAHLAQILGLQEGETPSINVSLSHRDGFVSQLRDVTGDGVLDLVMNVPHFSQPWFTVSNSNQNPLFRRVEMTGTGTAWITGGPGTVHRYAGNVLQRYTIPGTTGETRGLHIVSDTEFYVAVAGNCYSSPRTAAKVAHYVSGTFTSLDLGLADACEGLGDVWMSSDQSYGYAAGDSGVFFKYTAGSTSGYTNGAWMYKPRPSQACTILDLEFASGTGWLGLGRLGDQSCEAETTSSSVMHYDGTSFTTSLTTSALIFESRKDGSDLWSVGLGSSGGMVYRRQGTTWSSHTMPTDTGAFRGLTLAPGGGIIAVGDRYSRPGEGRVVSFDGSTATTADTGVIPYLYGVDITGTRNGLAVGANFVMKYIANTAPTVVDSLPSASGNTRTWFTGSDTGSYDLDSDPITHRWEWDESYKSYSSSSTHQFGRPGTYTVRHFVTDNADASSSHSQTVTVSAESLTLGTGVSGTLESSAGSSRSHHFYASGVSGKVLKVQVTGNVKAIAATDAAPGDSGSWPHLGAYATPSSPMTYNVQSGTLNVAVLPTSSGSQAYTLTVSEVAAPSAPTVSSFTSPHNGFYGFSYTAATNHPASVGSIIKVEWGDGAVQEVEHFKTAGSTFHPWHKYSAPGTYTVKTYTRDIYNRDSASTSNSLTVVYPATLTPTSATSITATSASLQGTLDNLGGSSSVQVRFKLKDLGAGTTSTPCGWNTMTSTGTVSACSVTLTSGRSYSYWMESNDATAPATSATSNFESLPNLTSPPQLTASTLTTAVGTATSLSFKSSASNPNNVFYWVTWGDGSPAERVPSSGSGAWDTVRTATHTYGWSGSFPVEVRLEDTTTARSSPTKVTASVTGTASNVAVKDARLDDVVLRLTLGSVASGVDARIGYYQGTSATPTYFSWSTGVSSGSTDDRTTVTLSRSATHRAFFELQKGDAKHTSPVGSFQTNRAPTLTAGIVPSSISYEDGVTYRVTYRDNEGDAPQDASGNALLPTITVAGATHDLHASLGSSDFKAGVEYTYALRGSDLTQGSSYVASFDSRDKYQTSNTATSAPVLVKVANALTNSFEADSVNSIPLGFTVDGSHGHYWHVTTTTGANRVARLALGNHGQAVWFGVENQMDYSDTRNTPVVGSLVSKPVDLRLVQDPVLSFSSFYETEDTSGQRDYKAVEARSRTSGGSWGNWEFVTDIEGNEGGYGSWRSQSVGLARYANKEVQVRFTFNSIDPQHNGYLGWLVDDVSIGHDQDQDKLPDGLEQERGDMAISGPYVPLKIPEQGVARGFVRRIHRVGAQAMELDALVRHSNPSNLGIWVGYVAPPNKTAPSAVKVYGSGANSCINTVDTGSGTVASGTSFDSTSDGLRVRLNLQSCNFQAWTDAIDWFFHIQDAGGYGAGTLEDLRIVSAGMTDERVADTDRDGVKDGAEVASIKDPLGYDGDLDGVPTAADPDDRVPTWAPALRVSTQDKFQNMQVRFQDIVAPLAFLKAQGLFPGSSSTKPFGVTSQGGTSWFIPLHQYSGEEPTRVDVLWKDVYGNKGTISMQMQRTSWGSVNTGGGTQYAPVGVDWEATDVVTQERVSFVGETLPQLAVNGVFFVVALATPIPGDEPAAGAALGVSLSRLRFGTTARAVASAGVAIVAATPTAWYAKEVFWDHSHTATATGAWVLYTEAELADAALKAGLTTQQVKDAIQSAQRSVDAGGGLTRWVYESAGKLIVVVTSGHWFTQYFQHVWQWQMPASVNYANAGRTVEELLLIEDQAYSTIWNAGIREQFKLILTQLLPFLCAQTTPFNIQSTSPGLNPGREDQTFVPTCALILAHEMLSIVEDVDEWAFRQNLIDTMIGQSTFGHLKHQASIGNFDGEFYWYWDDDPSATTAPDCGTPTTWAHADIRRCNDYAPKNKLGDLELGNIHYQRKVPFGFLASVMVKPTLTKTYTIPDVVSVRYLDWDTSGVEHFRDAFSSDGVMVNFQDIATNGLDYKSWALGALGDEMPDLPLSFTPDGDVRVTYTYTDAFMDMNVDFRGFGT